MWNKNILPPLPPSWLNVLKKELEQPYFGAIEHFLLSELQEGKQIYPPNSQIFAAFAATPFEAVKVVILGQDPYHGAGQANGLAFSVAQGVAHPKSLTNIFKEVQQQTGAAYCAAYPVSGDLTPWAKQGVFLLNSILTVQAQQAASHQHIGWQQFTNAVIGQISEKKEGVVFLLWGKYAQSKATLIDTNKHFILQSAHPSPLSVHRGFWGNAHFVQTNKILIENGSSAIDWSLSR